MKTTKRLTREERLNEEFAEIDRQREATRQQRAVQSNVPTVQDRIKAIRQEQRELQTQIDVVQSKISHLNAAIDSDVMSRTVGGVPILKDKQVSGMRGEIQRLGSELRQLAEQRDAKKREADSLRFSVEWKSFQGHPS